MRNRIRLLALAVVAMGGATLASPREAQATLAPPPVPQYCCCEVQYGQCTNRCCSMFGCSAVPTACNTATRPT